MSTHNYRIDCKFAPKVYSIIVERLKRSYNRKLALMHGYFATFSCEDIEALIKENKWLKYENNMLKTKFKEVCIINQRLRDKLLNFAEIDNLSSKFWYDSKH